MHPTLRRLDDLAHHLADRDDALALLGLGSAGVEHDRFDEHSDIDFFVVARDDAAKRAYLAEPGWLGAMGEVAFNFANDANGQKVLYADGLFVEYAVFTPEELDAVPYVGARIVWQRLGADVPSRSPAAQPPPNPRDTVEFHVGEAITNLFVGLHRELRGERLTAMRFIQVFAVDRVLAVLRLTEADTGAGAVDDGRPPHRRDVFEATRRVEDAYPGDVLPLAAMCPGYLANRAAAAATLGWLRERFTLDPAMASAIEGLLGDPDATSTSSGPAPGGRSGA